MGERSLSNTAELEADLRYVIAQAPGMLWQHGAHLQDNHPQWLEAVISVKGASAKSET